MPTLGEMYPSKWLKAADIGDAELKATIRTVTKELFEDRERGESEHKWVLWFFNAEKGLILNKTNGTQVGEHYGEHTDGWIGRQVTLFTMDVSAFGKMTNAIRIKVTPENVAANNSNGGPAATTPQPADVVYGEGNPPTPGNGASPTPVVPPAQAPTGPPVTVVAGNTVDGDDMLPF